MSGYVYQSLETCRLLENMLDYLYQSYGVESKRVPHI